MGWFGGQMAKGLLMGGGRILWMTSDKKNYKGESLTQGIFLPASPLGFPGGSVVKNLPANVVEMQVQYLGQEDPLEKEMVTYSSILAWIIP